ncbi:hypothetical protein ACS0TY_008122 [Phlomoides rotata]
MSVRVDMVGTQFKVAPPSAPLPTNISLVNDGWLRKILSEAPTSSSSSGLYNINCDDVLGISAAAGAAGEKEGEQKQIGHHTS